MDAGSFEGADNQSEESQQKPGYSVFVWIVAAAPLLYVLSIAPVAKFLVKRNAMAGSAFRQIYGPVIWLHDHTPLKKPLEAYVALWGLK
jgi:hypothetical protein